MERLPLNFNWKAYLVSNPDVARVSCTQRFAINHYITYGYRENRSFDPNFVFDWTSYHPRQLNEENALRHYIFMKGRDQIQNINILEIMKAEVF